MIISFAGHSIVSSKDEIKEIVNEQIQRNIIHSKSVTCYLGGYGDFDEICAMACRELKRENQKIELVYITPYLTLSEQTKIKEMLNNGLCDSSMYPPIEKALPKYAISKRNEWMMCNANLIIAYVKHEYGGAYKSLQVAKRKHKKIINICDFL